MTGLVVSRQEGGVAGVDESEETTEEEQWVRNR